MPCKTLEEMDVNSSNMIPLHQTTSRKRLDHKREAICIFGTGDFGRSLGMRLLKSGYQVVFGSRNPQNSTLLPSGAQVCTHADALKESEIIFLAVHRENYDFLSALSNLLDGKVLVDVSNNLKMNQYPESNAQYLSQLVPKAIVVKGFNTVSAWALQSGSLDANSQLKKNSTSEMEVVWSWKSDAFYASGILGFSVFCLLGITSLPSVSNVMNWREFRFVQSKLGHVTLLLCTVHTALLGWNKFLILSLYKWGLPPAYLLSMVIPCIVLALKLILITPCVDRMVTRIRQGWERKGKGSSDLNI
ncbi:metalloreductase STEAP4-like isoform X3 [Pristis pectinata]|uniref:metalloreductase STEAP4-like isoform X3 n=1 Tax=Pristis pectinata TaxID=685728 RepID=UPI00223D9C92|nr:metalloreductase STEAP4-like isoform X3 [Pristis pectinata]